MILLTLCIAACGKSSPPPVAPAEPVAVAEPPAPAPTEPEAPPAPPPPKSAKVELAPTTKSKSKVKGTISFREVDGGVEVSATVEGLKANQEHAWHIHDKGDCSAPDAKSAGDHFNPENHAHAGPEADQRHAGDFGNLLADKQGKASKTVTMKGITIAEGPTSIVGKGFIIHAKKDEPEVAAERQCRRPDRVRRDRARELTRRTITTAACDSCRGSRR